MYPLGHLIVVRMTDDANAIHSFAFTSPALLLAFSPLVLYTLFCTLPRSLINLSHIFRLKHVRLNPSSRPCFRSTTTTTLSSTTPNNVIKCIINQSFRSFFQFSPTATISIKQISFTFAILQQPSRSPDNIYSFIGIHPSPYKHTFIQSCGHITTWHFTWDPSINNLSHC